MKKFCFLVCLTILIVGTHLTSKQVKGQSNKVTEFLGSGVKVSTALGHRYMQFPLATYGAHTVVQRLTYGSEDALLFYVIKMPNGFGKLYVTTTKLAYEPEGGMNTQAFVIERSTIQAIVLQNNWQQLQNFPNINVTYSKDKKQFGINRTVGSSEYAQIDLSKYSFVLLYLQMALTDFDNAVRLFDEIFAEVERSNKAAEEIRLAEIAAREKEERERKAKEEEERRKDEERFRERLKIADDFSEERKKYNQEVREFILQRKSPGRAFPAAVKPKVELAIKALRRMNAASEVGVIFNEYSSRLIDTKATVDEATEILPEGLLKTELQLAVRSYVDAGRVWNMLIQRNRDSLVEQDEEFWILIDRYPLRPISIDRGSRNLIKQRILDALWQTGNEHLRNAAALAALFR